MNNIYLMLFDPAGVHLDDLLAVFDREPDVVNYHASAPDNLVIVVSALTAERLAGLIQAGVPTLSYYVFVRVDSQALGRDVFGWLPRPVWDFISRYESADANGPSLAPVPPRSAAVSVSTEPA